MTNRNSGQHTALDAVRLLCNAIQKVHHYDHHDESESMSPPCKTSSELILQSALEYLAWGDTQAARALMDAYDEWHATGKAPWPFEGTINPYADDPAGKHDPFNEIEEDEGGGIRLKQDDDDGGPPPGRSSGGLDDNIPS
jgi:hypothetical protein